MPPFNIVLYYTIYEVYKKYTPYYNNIIIWLKFAKQTVYRPIRPREMNEFTYTIEKKNSLITN